VANGQNQYHQTVLLNLANQPVHTNPIAPQAVHHAAQRSAIPPRIGRACDAFAQIAQNLTLSGWIEPT
jgi:hypothetical protein